MTEYPGETPSVGLRTLVVAGRGKPAEDELRRLIAEDAIPDAVSAEDPLDPTFVDDRLIATVPGLRGRLVRRLPYRLAQVVEVMARAREYDVILTWSDQPSIMIAAAMRLWRRRPAQVAILFWPSPSKKAVPLRLVQRGIDRFVVNSPLQRRFLENRLGIAADRFADGRVPVDTRFWRPGDAGDAGEDLICAVGQEMRDYATLIEALRPLDIPCHIAVGTTIFGTTTDRWWRQSLAQETLPPSVTVGPKSFTELRELYARSRFVVVPLIPSDNDSGITAILEAMAMGKAVIVTDTPGQVGVLEDGVNCLRVAPFDAVALREAITRLWEDPQLCERLGAAGREKVAAQHGLDRWTETLTRAAREAHAVRQAARG